MSAPSPSFRRPTSSPATLVCKDGTSVPCIVRNLSMGGAKVEIEIDTPVSDECHLTAAELGVTADAIVVWRIERQVGIRFAAKLRPERGARAPHRPAPVDKAISLSQITGAPRRPGAAR